MRMELPMYPQRLRSRAAWAGARAFSLIEIMVVVALLSVIILGLVAMFNQTQRAFLSGTTQIDLLESGRIASDFVARDLEQMVPSYSNSVNFSSFGETGNAGASWSMSLYLSNANAAYPPKSPNPGPPPQTAMVPPNYSPISAAPAAYAALYQPYSGVNVAQAVNQDVRTNVLQSFYFVSRSNQQWYLTGYFVDHPDLGVGTLYRTNYAITNFSGAPYIYPANAIFVQAVANNLASPAIYPPTNFSRIADGLVHFRVTPYDTNGILITNVFSGGGRSFMTPYQSIWALGPDGSTGDYYYSFYSNAVPAYVELEMGFLEPRTLDRYRSFSNNPTLAADYLQRHVGKVHIFRQHIPIRNVDPAAYHPYF